MGVVDFLVEPMQLDFMVRATLITLTASAVCATCRAGWSSSAGR